MYDHECHTNEFELEPLWHREGGWQRTTGKGVIRGSKEVMSMSLK